MEVVVVIAGEPEGSRLAGGQQEGLQYNGESAWCSVAQIIGIYIISADVKKYSSLPPTMVGYKSYIYIIPSLAFHQRRLIGRRV